MKKPIRIIISGGGTGGHIYPAISIANALKAREPEADILFVGALGRMEMEKVPAEGYRIVGLPVAGLQRKLSLRNLILPFKVLRSLLKARQIIKDFRPQVAVGVGGYASAPLLWAAGRKHIPIVIQEQNSFAGLTNKILGGKAQQICTAYPGMERFFPAGRIVLTGNPIRGSISPATPERKARGLAHFGLDPAQQTLLVIGGSLGSATLNRCIAEYVETAPAPLPLQILWQCGKHYHNAHLEAAAARHPAQVKLMPFISRMDLAYAAADIVVSRSGASSISEICAAGKACIFVPSPNVAEDHQRHNAQSLVDRGAALMVTDYEAPERLMEEVLGLCARPHEIELLAHNAAGLATPGAADHIADLILNCIPHA